MPHGSGRNIWPEPNHAEKNDVAFDDSEWIFAIAATAWPSK
jgi:hypothetical protein